MPLPLTVSCFSKIQIGFTFLVPRLTWAVLKKGPLTRVCVTSISVLRQHSWDVHWLHQCCPCSISLSICNGTEVQWSIILMQCVCIMQNYRSTVSWSNSAFTGHACKNKSPSPTLIFHILSVINCSFYFLILLSLIHVFDIYSASEVTTLWRYTNLFTIIIIIIIINHWTV